MSTAFRFRHLNRIVGVFVLSAAAVLIAGLVLVGRTQHWNESTVAVDVDFPASTTSLLRPGLPVRILGADAGEITAAHLATGGRTLVTLALRTGSVPLHSDCYALVHTPVAGLLGDTFIEIWPGESPDMLDLGSPGHGGAHVPVIPGRAGEDVVELARQGIASFGKAGAELRDMVAENRVQFAAMIASVKRTADHVDSFAVDERPRLSAALARVEAAADEIEHMVAENRNNVRALGDRLPGAVADLQSSARAVTAAGDSGRTTMADTAADVQRTLAHISSAAAAMQQDAAAAEPALKDAAAVAHQVASGQGSVGQAVMDDKLATQARDAVAAANARLAELAPVTTAVGGLTVTGLAEGGYDTRSRSGTVGVGSRLGFDPEAFMQAEISHRSPARGVAGHERSLDIDLTLVAGWKPLAGHAWSPEIAAGLVETEPGGWAVLPLWRDRLALRALVRAKHHGAGDDPQREEGSALVRATVEVRVWRGLWIAGGVDDAARAPGPWAGGRLEIR
jgi:ABC-type transporter Mla subunit MlaD